MIQLNTTKDFHDLIECPICSKKGVSVWVYSSNWLPTNGFPSLTIRVMDRRCRCTLDTEAWRKLKLSAVEHWENVN